MRIQIIYDKNTLEGSLPDGEKVSLACNGTKTYESDDIDEEIKNASAGKRIDRFIIQDLQITSVGQVNDAIDMLMGVSANIKRQPVKDCITPKDFPMDESVNLHDTFDARIWASEFCKRFNADEDLMLSWFANAIMAGSDVVSRNYIEEIKLEMNGDHYTEGTYSRGFLNGLEKALSIVEGRGSSPIHAPNVRRVKAIHIFRSNEDSSVYHSVGYENVDEIVLRDGKFHMLKDGVALREVKESAVDQVDYMS